MANQQGRRTNSMESDLIERVVHIARVAKVVKGGKRFGFRALVVVGDGRGMVGVGTGKGKQVNLAIQKATTVARKEMRKVNLRQNRTIPHEIMYRFCGARVILKPAVKGTGVIAGRSVRAVAECAGIQDLLSKSLGSSNALNVTKATFEALTTMRSPKESLQLRGLWKERSTRRSSDKEALNAAV